MSKSSKSGIVKTRTYCGGRLIGEALIFRVLSDSGAAAQLLLGGRQWKLDGQDITAAEAYYVRAVFQATRKVPALPAEDETEQVAA